MVGFRINIVRHGSSSSSTSYTQASIWLLTALALGLNSEDEVYVYLISKKFLGETRVLLVWNSNRGLTNIFCTLSVRHFVEHLDDDDDDDVDFYKPLSYFVWRIFREMDKLLENHEFATHAVAASASVSLGTGLAYPLDTIKTIIQVGCKKLTPCQVVNRVFRVSGYSGQYSFVFIECSIRQARWCFFCLNCRSVQWSWMANSGKNLRCWC